MKTVPSTNIFLFNAVHSADGVDAQCADSKCMYAKTVCKINGSSRFVDV